MPEATIGGEAAVGDRLLRPAMTVRETPLELVLELALALEHGGELQVEPARAAAHVKDGVLTLHIPKAHPTGTTLEGFHPEVPPI